MPHEANGTGKGGKSFQDRELAARVRRLSLTRIKEILEDDKEGEFAEDTQFKKALILKLAGTVLPRLNEHAGPDNGDIPIGIRITFKDGSPIPD